MALYKYHSQGLKDPRFDTWQRKFFLFLMFDLVLGLKFFFKNNFTFTVDGYSTRVVPKVLPPIFLKIEK